MLFFIIISFSIARQADVLGNSQKYAITYLSALLARIKTSCKQMSVYPAASDKLE